MAPARRIAPGDTLQRAQFYALVSVLPNYADDAVTEVADDPTPIHQGIARDYAALPTPTGTRPIIGDRSMRDTMAIERAKQGPANKLTAATRIGAAIDPLTGLTADLPNPN